MGQQEKYRARKSILISLGVAAVCYAVVYKCFPMVYAINDDVMMRDIAAGAMTGEPDGHLIFVKYVLGILLSRMYRFFPGFDWYGLLLTGLIVFCLAILIYRGWSDIRDTKNKILYLVFVLATFICIGLQHMVMFQWTVTAGITGATGVFLFYTSSGDNRVKNVLEEIISAFLLVLTFCIRSGVLYMIVPAAGICYLFKYVRVERKEKWKVSVQHAWYWVLMLGGCAAVMLIEASAYQSEEWKEYQAFNACRSQVYDFYGVPEFEENRDFYESIDLKEQDVQALENYSLFLVDGIYEYKMEMIAEYAKQTAEAEKGIGRRLIDGLQEIYLDFQSGVYAPLIWFTAIVAALALLVCWAKRSSQFYLILACMGMQFLLWCYLGLQGRIVERVSFAMHFYMLFLVAGILYRELVEDPAWILEGRGSERGNRAFLIFGCMVLIFVSVLECAQVRGDVIQKEEQNQENLELQQYLEGHKENVYLMHTYSVSHYTDVFKLRRDFKMSNMVSLGDWPSFSPVEERKRELLGIVNPKEALYGRENVYVVSRYEVPYVEQCLQETYGSCSSQDADVVPFRNYLYWIKEFGE